MGGAFPVVLFIPRMSSLCHYYYVVVFIMYLLSASVMLIKVIRSVPGTTTTATIYREYYDLRSHQLSAVLAVSSKTLNSS